MLSILSGLVGALILASAASRSQYDRTGMTIFKVRVVDRDSGAALDGYKVAIIPNVQLGSTDILLGDDGIWKSSNRMGIVVVSCTIRASGSEDILFGLRGSFEPATVIVSPPSGGLKRALLSECLESKRIGFSEDGIPVCVRLLTATSTKLEIPQNKSP